MIKGSLIHLRTVREKDLEPLLDLMSDVASRGEHYPLHLPTETSLRARYSKDGFWGEDSGVMLVVENSTNEIVGQVVHFKPVHYYHAVEIGYIIFKPEHRGKGYLTEALKLFCAYLFDLMPIHRIQVQAEPANVASRRAAEKCGFEYEGTARSAFVSRGRPVDIDVLSLIRPPA
jgi:RimJ/RimL family protein N-acetyltransferase